MILSMLGCALIFKLSIMLRKCSIHLRTMLFKWDNPIIHAQVYGASSSRSNISGRAQVSENWLVVTVD